MYFAIESSNKSSQKNVFAGILCDASNIALLLIVNILLHKYNSSRI